MACPPADQADAPRRVPTPHPKSRPACRAGLGRSPLIPFPRLALGIGGLPRGRITEIYGPESSGKTTLCLHTIAEAQARGGICAFVDMEHALDPIYAERLGVDVGNLYIAQPDTAEQALEITEALVRSGALDVVVLDSAAINR